MVCYALVPSYNLVMFVFFLVAMQPQMDFVTGISDKIIFLCLNLRRLSMVCHALVPSYNLVKFVLFLL